MINMTDNEFLEKFFMGTKRQEDGDDFYSLCGICNIKPIYLEMEGLVPFCEDCFKRLLEYLKDHPEDMQGMIEVEERFQKLKKLLDSR